MPEFMGTPLGSAFVEIGGDTSRLAKAFTRAKGMTSSATSKMSKQAKVKLGLNLKAFTASLKKAKQQLATNLQSLNSQIKASQEKIQQNYGAILGLSRQIGIGMIAAGGAITGAFALAVRTTASFQQSMANVQSVAGATSAELQKLSNYARLMGKQSVFSASQAADAMYYLASAGMDTEKIMDSLKGTLQLAAATQSELASTTATVASMLAAFQLEAKEADRISNVFAATISASQATMDKLAASMQYVAPVAKSVGLSIERTSAILGQLYNAGIDASTAGTALRMGIAQLLDPTQEVTDTFQRLGVALYDSTGNIRPFLDLIRDLEKVNLQAADAMKIFGIRAGPGMLALIGQGTASLDKLIEKVTDTNKAAEMAAMQINTFQGALKLWNSAVEELQISIGTTLLPALTSMLKGITSITNALSTLAAKFPTLTSTMAKMGAVLGPMLIAGGALALMAPTLINIAKAASFVAPAIAGFGAAALAATPYVAGLAAAAYALYRGIKLLREPIDRAKVDLEVYRERTANLQDALGSLAGALQVYEQTGDRTSATVGDLGLNTNQLTRQTGLLIKETDNAERILNALQQAFFKASEKAADAAKAIEENTDAVEDNKDATSGAAKAWSDYAEGVTEAQTALQKIEKAIQNVEKAQAAQKQILSTWQTQLGKISEVAERAIGEGVKAYQFRIEMGEPELPFPRREALQAHLAEYRQAFAATDKQMAALADQRRQDELAGEKDATEVKKLMLQEWLNVIGRSNDEIERDHQKSLDAQVDAEYDALADRRKILAFVVDYNKRAADQLQSMWQDLVEDWPEPVAKPLAEWANVAKYAIRDVEHSISDLFVSLIDPTIKPAWADFWTSLKDIAIRTLADIASAELMSGITSGIKALLAGGGISGFISAFPPLAVATTIAVGAYAQYKIVDAIINQGSLANDYRSAMVARLNDLAAKGGDIQSNIRLLKTMEPNLGKISDATTRTAENTAKVVELMSQVQRPGRGPVPRIYGERGPRAEEVLSRLGRLQAGRGGRPRTITEFQFGGIVKRPTLGLLGEAGPEAIIPLRRGTAQRQSQPQIVQPNITMEKGAVQINESFPNLRWDTLSMDQRIRMLEQSVTPAMREWLERGVYNRLRR